MNYDKMYEELIKEMPRTAYSKELDDPNQRKVETLASKTLHNIVSAVGLPSSTRVEEKRDTTTPVLGPSNSWTGVITTDSFKLFLSVRSYAVGSDILYNGHLNVSDYSYGPIKALNYKMPSLRKGGYSALVSYLKSLPRWFASTKDTWLSDPTEWNNLVDYVNEAKQFFYDQFFKTELGDAWLDISWHLDRWERAGNPTSPISGDINLGQKGFSAADVKRILKPAIAALKAKFGMVLTFGKVARGFLSFTITRVDRSPSGQSRTASRTFSWSDYDRSAPWTPWGPAQHAEEIAQGVTVYSTAGHGGLGVAKQVARKYLSPAAIKEGSFERNHYWYEEDAAIYIPLFENPDWYQDLFGRDIQDSSVEAILQRYYPRYFDKVKDSPLSKYASKPYDWVGYDIIKGLHDMAYYHRGTNWDIVTSKGDWIVAEVYGTYLHFNAKVFEESDELVIQGKDENLRKFRKSFPVDEKTLPKVLKFLERKGLPVWENPNSKWVSEYL